MKDFLHPSFSLSHAVLRTHFGVRVAPMLK